MAARSLSTAKSAFLRSLIDTGRIASMRAIADGPFGELASSFRPHLVLSDMGRRPTLLSWRYCRLPISAVDTITGVPGPPEARSRAA